VKGTTSVSKLCLKFGYETCLCFLKEHFSRVTGPKTGYQPGQALNLDD
jgi:hypothetical protein